MDADSVEIYQIAVSISSLLKRRLKQAVKQHISNSLANRNVQDSESTAGFLAKMILSWLVVVLAKLFLDGLLRAP